MKNKILSGSPRDKTGPTPKENKWYKIGFLQRMKWTLGKAFPKFYRKHKLKINYARSRAAEYEEKRRKEISQQSCEELDLKGLKEKLQGNKPDYFLQFWRHLNER